MEKIGIINYGVGNLRSVQNSLNHLGIPNVIVNKASDVKKLKKIILPGVGAFGSAMEKLDSLGFTAEIKLHAKAGKPILGICLGMQLLFEESREHGNHPGLSLLKGCVLPLKAKVRKLPLPLIGWTDAKIKKDSVLVRGLDKNPSFYSVHGFYCAPKESSMVIADSDYGIKFASIVHRNNIYGCQFHPEKSQSAGLKILENFAKLC